jgi:hypothetical protein
MADSAIANKFLFSQKIPYQFLYFIYLLLLSSSYQAMNTISTPMILLSNITNLVSVKLDQNNFMLWKFQITSTLKAYKLLDVVNGSYPCPEMYLRDTNGSPTSVVNRGVIDEVWCSFLRIYAPTPYSAVFYYTHLHLHLLRSILARCGVGAVLRFGLDSFGLD